MKENSDRVTRAKIYVVTYQIRKYVVPRSVPYVVSRHRSLLRRRSTRRLVIPAALVDKTALPSLPNLYPPWENSDAHRQPETKCCAFRSPRNHGIQNDKTISMEAAKIERSFGKEANLVIWYLVPIDGFHFCLGGGYFLLWQ